MMGKSMGTLFITLYVVVVVVLVAGLLLFVYFDLTVGSTRSLSYSPLIASRGFVSPISVIVLQFLNALFTGLVAVAVLVFAYYLFKVRRPHEAAKQRAENKVRASDRILRDDIEVLARTQSSLLDDAITLYGAQMEQGRDSGD